MFVLREWNGREDKRNKGKGKNVAQVIGFFYQIWLVLFSLMLSKQWKRLNFSLSFLQTEHSVSTFSI